VGITDQERFSPPTLTKTWFHQGPIGDEFGEWDEVDFNAEFWPGDPQMLSRSPLTTGFLTHLPRRVKRDALRTLRGSVLRTELYALDGTDRERRPYTVEEHLHGLCEVVEENGQPKLECEPRPDDSPAVTGDDSTPRIFFPHELARRTTQWERGSDPMTRFGFTEDYDEYGQPQRQTQIACPRGWRNPDAPPARAYLATRTKTVYARPIDAQRAHIVDRVAKTTTYEIKNDGTQRLFELKDLPEDSDSLKVIGQTLNFYDGDAFEGLPFGQLGDYGALMCTEDLVLTKEILHEAYKSAGVVQTPPEEPPYLSYEGSPIWSAEYPQEFRDKLSALAGYAYHAGGAEHHQSYFATTERRRYDFHDDPDGKGHGLVIISRDPLGRQTTIAYDEPYYLLPKEVTEPVGLKTTAEYDYRVLQPGEVTDPNNNSTRFTFTPLGLLQDTWVLSKPTNNEGDKQRPSVRMEYDFPAFADRGSPISVRSIRHVHHDTETDVPPPQRDQTIQTVEYSDGVGRLLQTRTQAEDVVFGDPPFGNQVLPSDQSQPGGDAVGSVVTDPASKPRVVLSGWQTYDNKGRVLEKYEPFFSEGWEYKPPTDAQLGQKATMFYDPRGQVVRTVNPDGSEQRVIYGVPPIDFSNANHDPTRFTPTPWETYTYDANDNAGRTHPAASTGYQNHRNTPTSAVLDALGRTVEIVERDGPNAATDWYTTRSTYDIRGNLLTVTDPLGRLAFRYVYDLANRALRTEQLDAGLRRLVIDAAGNTLEQRDSKGALRLSAYDAANRPVRLWARDGAGQPLTLRERLIYGDNEGIGLSVEQAAAKNLLGKPYKHYDEAGLLSFEAYDFRGNVLDKSRQAIGDAPILAVFTPPPPKWQVKAFRVNWQPSQGTTLEAHASKFLDPIDYRISLAYDALNRVKTMRYPQDVSGARKELRPKYNRAGSLESVELDGKTYVERIAYNAKGQRTFVAYGNGVMTRHAYDPKTFHLIRMRTERYTKPSAFTYHPTGTPLQDFTYEYDLAGNLLALRDRTPGCGLATKPNALDRVFTYDPLYRLLSATGRECDSTPPAPWSVGPRCTDITRSQSYKETYQYTAAGSLRRLQHQAASGAFTRILAQIPNSNRLAKVTVGAKFNAYAYDASGNLIREDASRHFEWDHTNRMRVYRTQVGDAEPSVHAHYLYNSGGQLVKKLVRKQGQIEVTIYVDGIFEHQRVVTSSAAQNNTLHVMDNQKRVAQVQVGKSFASATTPPVKYHLGDHLGNSNVAIDETGSWVNREEYTPYGETSFGSFARKRYRFTGKERDEESGFYYHGARHYAPWLARWISVDPLGLSGPPQDNKVQRSIDPYCYAENNPLVFVDVTGLQSISPESTKPPITYDIGKLHLIEPRLSPPPPKSGDIGDIPVPVGDLGTIGIPPLFAGSFTKTPEGDYKITDQLIHSFEMRGSTGFSSQSLSGNAYGRAQGTLDWNPKAGYTALIVGKGELDVFADPLLHLHLDVTAGARMPTSGPVTLNREGLSGLGLGNVEASGDLSASLRVGNFRLLSAEGSFKVSPESVLRHVGSEGKHSVFAIEQELQFRATGTFSAPLVLGGQWSASLRSQSDPVFSVSGHVLGPAYLGPVGPGLGYSYFSYNYRESMTYAGLGVGINSLSKPSVGAGLFFYHSWY
jgi:RHS repeat-associated protein